MDTTLRKDALAILTAGIERVNPFQMVRRTVSLEGDLLTVQTEIDHEQFDLADYQRIIVNGAGKATAPMARAIEEILGDRLIEGVIAIKPGHGDTLQRVRMIEAGHPVPDGGSRSAAETVLALARSVDERTLVINLISGGGSALLTLPYQDESIRISLEDMKETTAVLLGCGATIQEINCVRKHISAIKGGRMAAAFAPARVLSLILSDVVGDDLSSIASGLTAPDETTYADVERIFRKYTIEEDIPRPVRELLQRGLRGDAPDTPGSGDAVFATVHNILLGSNAQALAGARQTARQRGYNTVVLSSQITGEAREIARFYAGIARDLRRAGPGETALAERPVCVIAGGETTVTLRGSGKGGRNQEMAIAFLGEFFAGNDSLTDMLFLS
nr:DUF4147 domain-containing protein [Spirochaeta sp.]